MADVKTIEALIPEFLTVIGNEDIGNGLKRNRDTIKSYELALNGFVMAMGHYDLPIEQLPEDFLERQWLELHVHQMFNAQQFSARLKGVKYFSRWLRTRGIAVPHFRMPGEEAKKRVHRASGFSQFDEKTLAEDPVTTLKKLAAIGQTQDPAPLAVPIANPHATLQANPHEASMTVNDTPQAAPEPTQSASLQNIIPIAGQARPAPRPAGRTANPLASMLPSSQFKLRVRRERETDDPVWVGDFPADRVVAAGAIEPFLGKEIAPRLVALGITGDVTFLVSAVAPDGKEGERSRITVTSPASPMAQQPPAPMSAHQAMPTPMSAHQAMPMSAHQGMSAQPAMNAQTPAERIQPLGGGFVPSELAEVLAQHRRAQEELEERLSRKFERPQAPVEDNRHDELNDLKQMVGQLAGSVRDLAMRVEDRRLYEPVQPAPLPAPTGNSQLDMLTVLRELVAMSKPVPQPPPPPAPPPMGLGEIFTVMGQAKAMFAPQNVNIDVSPLEEQISDLRTQISSQAKKKSGVAEMIEEVKGLKELFNIVGGDQSPSKPTSSLGSAIATLVERVSSDPAPFAQAVSIFMNRNKPDADGQMGAQMGGQMGAPHRQRVGPDGRPIGLGVAPVGPNGMPMQPGVGGPGANGQAPGIHPRLAALTAAVLKAEEPQAVVVAMHEWFTVLTQIPVFQKAAVTMTSLIQENKGTELAIYLRRVFTHLGYAEQATPERLSKLSTTLLESIHETDEDEDEDEEKGPPDLTIRVGGVRKADEADEADDDDGEADEDEGEVDEDDEDTDEDTSDADEVDASGDSDEETNGPAYDDGLDALPPLALMPKRVEPARLEPKRVAKSKQLESLAPQDANELVAPASAPAPAPRRRGRPAKMSVPVKAEADVAGAPKQRQRRRTKAEMEAARAAGLARPPQRRGKLAGKPAGKPKRSPGRPRTVNLNPDGSVAAPHEVVGVSEAHEDLGAPSEDLGTPEIDDGTAAAEAMMQAFEAAGRDSGGPDVGSNGHDKTPVVRPEVIAAAIAAPQASAPTAN
jgi:hypothetical protein